MAPGMEAWADQEARQRARQLRHDSGPWPPTLRTALATELNVELVICITSALRHGMLDPTEAERQERPAATIAPGFILAGLGDLVDAVQLRGEGGTGELPATL